MSQAGSGLGTFRGANQGSALVREDLYDTVLPSLAHRAIAELVRRELAAFVVTSNHDNLHAKSGVPADKLAELYGNCYVELCMQCATEFRRATTFPALGRACERCGGKLKKTGCRYGQQVPPEPTRRVECARRALSFSLYWSIESGCVA